MQFIDQSAAYTQKSITLEKALSTNRAKMTAGPGADALAQCFRPDLKTAIAFDLDIDERLEFNALSTPEKLDLLIDELLPKFFHPDLLALTEQPIWHVRFVVDGSVERTLQLDDLGLHDVSSEELEPDIEFETDVLTLLALLRSAIAEFHVKQPPYPVVPGQEDDDEVWGN